MDYPPNVVAIQPGTKWTGGGPENVKPVLFITIDPPLPVIPAATSRWIEKYRDERHPGFSIEYRNG